MVLDLNGSNLVPFFEISGFWLKLCAYARSWLIHSLMVEPPLVCMAMVFYACGWLSLLLLKTCWRLVVDFVRNGKIFITFAFAFYTSLLGNILHVTPPLTSFSQTLPSLAWELLNTFYLLYLMRLGKMVFNYSLSLPFFHFSIIEDFFLFYQASKDLVELERVWVGQSSFEVKFLHFVPFSDGVIFLVKLHVSMEFSFALSLCNAFSCLFMYEKCYTLFELACICF